ncbi:unnamed protein product [Rotaria sp. Silwood2]|nr:unnamed protein product [Rotaria sp. Silwood2]CAF2500279.1 unnamed protein product [Rotaria sp. Silwood2]CAF3961604.1 unnamed protein product [Rotaria sp. Silwood2]CAF4105879.1 unnamed protein product [Rotaria sp. Silwood2]
MASGKELTSQRLIPSTRFTLALLVSFALFILYAQRVSLAMGIVCMVNRTNINAPLNITSHSTQIHNRTIKISTKYGSQYLEDKQFFLTEFQQQILLGAHFLGYLLTLAPGGWISIKIGAKRTFAFGILLSSIATLAMVTVYYLDDFYFIIAVILRIITGLGHGPLFPSTYTFWSMWAVPLERSTLTSIGFCSTNLGTSVTMLIGGLLCRYVSSGWVYIFLLTSMFGFIWLPLWMWLVADSPLSHRKISEQERNYICERIGISTDKKEKPSTSFASVPWKKVLRSKPIMALVISQFCNLFGLFFFYTNVGKLLTEIHRVPSQQAGYVLAGGFIFMPIVSLSTGVAADSLVRKNIMSLTNVRKLFNSLTSFIPAACMIVLCFCDHTRQLLGIITVFIFLVGSAMAYGSGYVVNFGDIAPAYSSIIFSVASALGTVGALIGNIIAGIIIKQPILEDWRKLLLLFAIIYTIGGTVYLLYGSAVPRKWARFHSEESTQNEEDESLTTLPLQTDASNITKNTEIS